MALAGEAGMDTAQASRLRKASRHDRGREWELLAFEAEVNR